MYENVKELGFCIPKLWQNLKHFCQSQNHEFVKCVLILVLKLEVGFNQKICLTSFLNQKNPDADKYGSKKMRPKKYEEKLSSVNRLIRF